MFVAHSIQRCCMILPYVALIFDVADVESWCFRNVILDVANINFWCCSCWVSILHICDVGCCVEEGEEGSWCWMLQTLNFNVVDVEFRCCRHVMLGFVSRRGRRATDVGCCTQHRSQHGRNMGGGGRWPTDVWMLHATWLAMARNMLVSFAPWTLNRTADGWFTSHPMVTKVSDASIRNVVRALAVPLFPWQPKRRHGLGALLCLCQSACVWCRLSLDNRAFDDLSAGTNRLERIGLGLDGFLRRTTMCTKSYMNESMLERNCESSICHAAK
jgi:hypothetical protein